MFIALNNLLRRNRFDLPIGLLKHPVDNKKHIDRELSHFLTHFFGRFHHEGQELWLSVANLHHFFLRPIRTKTSNFLPGFFHYCFRYRFHDPFYFKSFSGVSFLSGFFMTLGNKRTFSPLRDYQSIFFQSRNHIMDDSSTYIEIQSSAVIR